MFSVIRLLEPQLINRIAAGEVIERPTSVIKELIENSLDAKATEIHVTVRGGGQTLIRIQDNGCGMIKEDLKLSVQRHTTSKLSHADLWNIHTFGFRGEALASITSVSKALLSSKTLNQPHGWSLYIEGGEQQDFKPVACDVGTCIEIRDLFFATPARLKFLRSPAQEHIQITNCLERFLLLNPHVTFSLRLDEKHKVFDAASLEGRIKQLLNLQAAEGFWLETQIHDVKVTGWAALPGAHRRNADRIFLYTNQRPIEDRMLVQSMRIAYQDLIPKDRYPCVIAFLSIPYSDVDVNVHPAKTQVRFKAPQEIRSVLITALRKSLIQYGQKSVSITPKMDSYPSFDKKVSLNFETKQDTESLYKEASEKSIAFSQNPPSVMDSFSLKESDFFKQKTKTSDKFQTPYLLGLEASENFFTKSSFSLKENISPSLLIEDCSTTDSSPLVKIDLGRPICQIQNRYIVSVSTQGLVIIDPHGAHERILYEEMKRQWKSFDVQFLIPPLVLSLTEAEKITVEMHRAALAEVGFPVEQQDETFVLKGIPAVLHTHPASELWDSVLQRLSEELLCSAQEIHQELLHHVLAYWACRKSVFLGDRLSLEEMDGLLRAMEKTPNSAQCNHGRKVYCVFSVDQISTWFDRNP
ncbi:DNA mismatch repair protein MutL [Holospora obtusa F1]|uniref:DNA mismatch repair protein MutL n=1 Tax=Holospora obtusa F1 TaxID=1399147 RepID=W6TE39_HOLOB|nr:DNA mismatch repair endonuclease MutL [Holospora obtusa]ETZ07176.1 DNA mismatch repair protein MutL [Holospora obtusa F1]